MNEREVIERVVGRIYRQSLAVTGRLPDGKAVRRMEELVKKAAEKVENRKKGSSTRPGR